MNASQVPVPLADLISESILPAHDVGLHGDPGGQFVLANGRGGSRKGQYPNPFGFPLYYAALALMTNDKAFVDQHIQGFSYGGTG